MRRLPGWILLLVLLAAAFFIGRVSAPAPAANSPSVVPDQVLLEARPSADQSLLEKITTKRVRPTQHAVSVGRPDTARIRRFCAAAEPAVQMSATDADSATSNEVAKQEHPGPTELLPPFAGRVSRGRLELHATLSSGRLWAAVYPIGTKAEWLSSGDSAIVTTPRRLFGLLELDPGTFAEVDYLPLTQRIHGRAGVSLGAADRQLRAGMTEHGTPYLGIQLQH